MSRGVQQGWYTPRVDFYIPYALTFDLVLVSLYSKTVIESMWIFTLYLCYLALVSLYTETAIHSM